ncbi:MAG: cysteine--tRNA ligase [Nitrospinae bacterium]|nr:cysteine--tRNA ligase [Nitrospinota bacterium]
MALRVYNTLTRKKELFEPITAPKVGMYVCGVTVYDLCHIGHARAGIVFDVVYRYLKFRGYDVYYVRNITDIDDKIINRANERGLNWADVAEKYTVEFHADMDALGLLRPNEEPKATGHLAEMFEIIATLVEKGHAYPSEGSVYFAVRSFNGYGKLSGKDLEDLLAGARVDVDETKRDPLDFALWKAAKPGEPSWDSPWGPGRPGWHIECSAMGRKYLGDSFDIHGGGKDLVFPHHENEIAQSEASSGQQPAQYWIHNGFVTVNSEKMSKSLGNFFTIKDLLGLYNPEAVRLFLLSSHYRSPIDFADVFVAEAYKNLARFYELLAFAGELGEVAEQSPAPQGVREQFIEVMDDDFNTAQALAVMNNELRRVNQLRAEMGKLKKKSPEFKKAAGEVVAGAMAIKELGGALGLFQQEPEKFLSLAKTEKLKEAGLTGEMVTQMIKSRTDARQNKDYKESDRIRDELASKGVLLHDTPEGTGWSVKFE